MIYFGALAVLALIDAVAYSHGLLLVPLVTWIWWKQHHPSRECTLPHRNYVEVAKCPCSAS